MIVKTIQKTSGNDKEKFEIVIVIDEKLSEYWVIAQYTDPDGSRHSTIGSAHGYNDNPIRFPADYISIDAGKVIFAALTNRNEPKRAEYIRGEEEVFYDDLRKWDRSKTDFLKNPEYSWALDWLQYWKEDRHEQFLDLFRENIHFPFVSPEKKAELLAGRSQD